MSGWRATIPTERLFGDPRFLRLEEHEQNLLIRLYARCDRWGRGPAHPRALGLHLMVLRADVRTDLDALARSGLVSVYSVAGDDYYQIADYDADAMRDTLRKRGASNYPADPGQTDTTQTDRSGQSDPPDSRGLGQTESALTPPSGQTQGRPGPAQGQSDPPSTADPGQTWAGPRADLGRENEPEPRPESAHARARGPARVGDSRAEQSRAEQSESRAARAGLPWPPMDQGHRAAAERYLDALTQHGHVGGPPSSVTPDGLAELAREYADAFPAGIDDAITAGPTWQGWRVRNPLNWLRQSCERARHKAAEERAKKPKRPPTYADLAAGAAPPEPPPRDPKRPPSYADLAAMGTPRLGDAP